MLKSFSEAIAYIDENRIRKDFQERLIRIADDAAEQNWMNWRGFEKQIKMI